MRILFVIVFAMSCGFIVGRQSGRADADLEIYSAGFDDGIEQAVSEIGK